jgi:hypothetical protein
VTRAWRALEELSERRQAPYALVSAALLVYAVGALAFPLAAGRDLGTYVRASFELRQAEVVLPQALLMRAPVTGVVSEALLELGPLVAETAMAVLYALSVLCWWRVGRRLGTAPGIASAGLLLVYPGYALLFHRLSSDALYAAAFALAALLTARLVEKRTPGRAAAVGGAFALLVLVRPVSQILVVLLPLLLLGGTPWRNRLVSLAALAAAAVLPLGAWAGHNALRADDFTVVRGAGHGLPLFRAMVVDRIVEPSNGDASRELARAVQDDLLPREPYRSYGIDLETFFSAGSARMHEDLIGLADRTWGWDDDYAHLARVGREAVAAHPGTYVRGVVRDSWRLLWWPLFLPVSEGDPEASSWTGYAPLAVDQLPEPSEGQPIPSASVSVFISTPDGRFREVWTSPTAHEIVADDPADAAHLDSMNRRVAEALGRFSDRDGSSSLGRWLNRGSRWFPRPVLWLLVGVAAVAIRRPRGVATPIVLALAALLVVLGTTLAVPAAAEYSTPLAPALLLLAAAGLLGSRSELAAT